MIISRYSLCIVLLILSFCLAALPAPGEVVAAPAAPPRVTQLPGAVRLDWGGALPALNALGAASSPQALVEIGGLRVPAALVALRIDGDAPIQPQIQALESQPFFGALPVAEQAVPQPLGGQPRPALAAAAPRDLPATPVVLLREGRMRGVRVAVLALSAVFGQPGAARAVTSLQATIAGARPFEDAAGDLLAVRAPFLAAAPAPTNPAAGVTSWAVRVASSGMQSLTAAALSAAGVSLSDPSRIHVRRAGAELSLDQRGSGASLELRFYAPAPGDRWNAADIYWLTVEATPGARMLTRTVAQASSSASPARDRGAWRSYTLYDTTMPGPDGDHYFTEDLKTGPGLADATTTALLTPTLPLASGSATLNVSGTTLSVSGSAYTEGQHTLAVNLGGEAHTASWSGKGDWSKQFTFSASAGSATITLVSGSAPDGVELDSVAWDRPVDLNAAGRGAFFASEAGTHSYQVIGPAANFAIYDITSPNAPKLLSTPSGTSFNDDSARQYVLTGPGTLFMPTLSKHQPADLTTPAEVLYIAPAEFQAALAPLVARRKAQGHSVRVIDVQSLYDAWSFGQVAPSAIRDFLRYAAASWSTPPAYVTLVGDGTADPLNYLKRNDPNYIPPYLAMVDPWLGETACEACYARLDGSDPAADPLPDLALGRLTVNSASELTAVVAKIMGYETSPLNMSWSSRSIYIADNFRDANGQTDPAGDFASIADASVAEQPAGLEIKRLYYDPSSASVGIPWREPNAVRAYQRTLALLNAGAGLVTYTGHSSQYQWAATDEAATPPYLLGLYDPDALTNGARLPIVLEMTCLTAAFQTSTYSRTTIDERWLIKPGGGAVALWGPTGFGVVHGHDKLLEGFDRALWAAPPQSAPLGRLTAAGYLELFSQGTCCQDTLATFMLLGDPLTPARVLPAKRIYAPVVRR